MAIRTILKYPDPGLSRPCEPVTIFDAALAALADDLLDTMRAAPGVGITAAHIGVFTRLVVLELSGQSGPRFYANPEILVSSDELMRNTEGSVSMPGANDEVERPKRVRFRYQDLAGAVHEEDADGFYSICMQHEIDQLDGIFWLKRLSRLKRDRLLRKWDKGK
ncbi:Peptide deformylase 1 [Neorhizobium galegae bv. officinalis bv. officinalis str. HAMBI 1141]|uniref:Peptide deformylase-like n=1 Tax=Neorhizobium galegae bv. officinalis bv. officinalis str. HAMBI 1141 TaxID=1028801 RepID=A0A068T6R3_NEOGA|nr:peptide deformylase [Neorhizobium galegae]CDN54183.1 Peptide deformylase 1 [Neorhizobium galegae bv. officinalis bv. officinalis str. HAMBI 1141]